MASNDSRQAEQQETYRNLSVDEARALVMAEVETCRDLLKTPPKTKDRLRTARNQYEKWRKYTATLLYPKIFSTNELAEEFAPIFDEFGWAGAPDTPRALQYDLNKSLLRLESIYERLEFYPEKPRQTTVVQKEMARVVSIAPQAMATGDNNEKTTLPPGLPKTEKGGERAKKISKIVRRFKQEYLRDFEHGYKDRATPTDTELIDAVNDDAEIDRKYHSAKRIRDLAKWVDMRLIE